MNLNETNNFSKDGHVWYVKKWLCYFGIVEKAPDLSYVEGWNLDICYIFYINGISVRAHWLGFLWLYIMSIDIEFML